MCESRLPPRFPKPPPTHPSPPPQTPRRIANHFVAPSAARALRFNGLTIAAGARVSIPSACKSDAPFATGWLALVCVCVCAIDADSRWRKFVEARGRKELCACGWVGGLLGGRCCVAHYRVFSVSHPPILAPIPLTGGGGGVWNANICACAPRPLRRCVCMCVRACVFVRYNCERNESVRLCRTR